VLADSFRWFHLWLILHIMAVVAAFGPTFAFGLIAALGQKKPQHAAFAVEVMDTIQRRMTIPVAVAVPILGTLLIYTGHFDLWKSEWLLIAIGLYIVLFGFAVFVQNPNSARMLQLLSAPPPPGTAGPPPEVAALGKKLQMGGAFLGVLILSILVLMVWRPGSCQGAC
jgi:hypothetical protein